MIARDNERTIAAALGSVLPWVEEAIVVDTGSIDQTPEIAKRLGARVEYFPWCDDFSAARNRSLEFASGDWILWIDTDDTLPEECGRNLREILDRRIPADVLGLIMQVHCPSNAVSNGNLDCAYQSSKKNSCSTIVDHVKVFRNIPELRFEGRIHEQILPSIRRLGGRVEWTDHFVVHSGADYTPLGMKRKLDRDLRLLRLDLRERPNHPFVLFNLGMTLIHMEAFAEARKMLERCVAVSGSDESHLRKAYVLLAESLESLGLRDEAKRRCWEGLGRYPHDTELAFRLGRLLMLDEFWDEAVEAFQRIDVGYDRPRVFSSVDPAIRGYKLYANLAVCHRESEKKDQALQAWIDCLTYAPDFRDAWDGIIELCIETGNRTALQNVAAGFGMLNECRPLVIVAEASEKLLAGSIDETKKIFCLARESGSADPFVLNSYARLLNEQGEWELSIPVLVQLTVLDPDNPSPQFNLGISLHQLGRFSEARVAFQAALRMRPGHHRTLSLLKNCEENISTSSTAEPNPNCVDMMSTT